MQQNAEARRIDRHRRLELCGPRFQLDGLNATGNSNYENVQRCIGQWAGSASGSDAGIAVYGEALDVPPFSSIIVAQRFEGVGPGRADRQPWRRLRLARCAHHRGRRLRARESDVQVPGVWRRHARRGVFEPRRPRAASALWRLLVRVIDRAGFRPEPGHRDCGPRVPGAVQPDLLGFQLDSQWIALNTVSGACPLLPDLSGSNILRSTIGL